MDKIALKKFLIQSESDKAQQSEIDYEKYLADNNSAENDVVDMDAQSHHQESMDIAEKLEDQIHLHEKNIDQIKEINFSPMEAVGPGAIVETATINLIIASSIPAFTFEGKKYIGVSPQAPLYQCLEGKKAGEKCTFNNTTFDIKAIH